MIQYQEYLSNLSYDEIEDYTGLAIDELEEIAGRFSSRSQWAGKLRGQLRVHFCGRVEIFNNFKTKKNPRKVIWSTDEIDL